MFIESQREDVAVNTEHVIKLTVKNNWKNIDEYLLVATLVNDDEVEMCASRNRTEMLDEMHRLMGAMNN